MKFSDLVGKTLTKAEQRGDDVVCFEDAEGKSYILHHDQDCCESVRIEDVNGDLNDLVDSPVLFADEVDGEIPATFDASQHESVTWTFYRIGTIKGTVVLRWLGESNGYYSESVSFSEA